MDSAAPIILNIVGGFLAGIALLLCQSVWHLISKWIHRRATVELIRRFFGDWEARTKADTEEDAFRFYYHETMIQRMDVNLTIYRSYLSAKQWS